MNFQIPNFLPAIAEIFQASMALLILLIISFCRHSARASRIAFWLSLTTFHYRAPGSAGDLRSDLGGFAGYHLHWA
ncbi:MAG: hypothetical protein IPL70_19235 [Uliginosibacterium sp.]|nr:hypothetical protein [Uliginosibacterium sp.]